MFRVVADQLKISDGWVRCGHCSDVFDATIQLEAWVPPAPARGAAPPPTPVPMPVPIPATADTTATTVPAAADRGEDAVSTQMPGDDLASWFGEEPLPPPPLATASPTATAVSAVDPDFHSELQQFASASGRATAAGPLTEVPALVAQSAAEAVAVPRHDTTPSDPPPTADEPGFVRQARRRAFWSSPGVQAGTAVMTVLLGLLLAGQWAVQERHRLLAGQPALKPWIEQACGLLGCTLEPLRRIDAVVIDSSELVRRLGNFYSFDLVVKNTAEIDVAVPALELSLTDSNDTVIARRVFLPQEWPNAPTVLPASGNLAVSFRLSLTLGESTPMAGYRALVFYP